MMYYIKCHFFGTAKDQDRTKEGVFEKYLYNILTPFTERDASDRAGGKKEGKWGMIRRQRPQRPSLLSV